MTKTNKYEHPVLFKGTRLVRESGDEVPGLPDDKQPMHMSQVPFARLWRDVKGVEALGKPEVVLGPEVNYPVTVLVLKAGFYYVTDPHAEVLAAWELWLAGASLKHRNLLSN
jgi:hypothetical protein